MGRTRNSVFIWRGPLYKRSVNSARLTTWSILRVFCSWQPSPLLRKPKKNFRFSRWSFPYVPAYGQELFLAISRDVWENFPLWPWQLVRKQTCYAPQQSTRSGSVFFFKNSLPHCSRVAVLSQGQLWNAHAMFQQCFSMRPHNMLEPRCWDDQCSSNFSAIFASFWPLTVPYMTPTQFFALYLNLLSKKHVFSPQYSTYIMITCSSNLRKSCDFFE